MSQLAYAKYGVRPTSSGPVMPVGSGLSNGAVTGSGAMGRLNPENPMVWLFGIGAVTLGFIAATTSIKVGPLKASASV